MYISKGFISTSFIKNLAQFSMYNEGRKIRNDKSKLADKL